MAVVWKAAGVKTASTTAHATKMQSMEHARRSTVPTHAADVSLGDLPSGHEAPLQSQHLNGCALEDAACNYSCSWPESRSHLGALHERKRMQDGRSCDQKKRLQVPSMCAASPRLLQEVRTRRVARAAAMMCATACERTPQLRAKARPWLYIMRFRAGRPCSRGKGWSTLLRTSCGTMSSGHQRPAPRSRIIRCHTH